ncbi:MAG: sensor histidine kinase [Actinomycetales bacterium]
MSITEIGLTESESERLSELTAEWQLLADLSFADLVLWVPTSDSEVIALAQIRPMTAATVFAQDHIGSKLKASENENIFKALQSGQIIRDLATQNLGDFSVKEEFIPVKFQEKVIAVITRHRNIETMRTPSRLELNYREIANQIYRMVSQGDFPVQGSFYLAESAPRVGDGLVRLDSEGKIVFASPNARSAFGKLGWNREMDSFHFGEILDELSVQTKSREPREENWRVVMSGKTLRREEFENTTGILDLLAIPLTELGNRIGAIVLVHNVTELKRRDRALISKDATIREIHHRVKNNLQSVSALLRLQGRRISDEGARAALEEAVRRIGSIAHVHETLSSGSKDALHFDEVVEKIIKNGLELSPRPGEIQISKVGEFGQVTSLVATPLALILSELIQNALEHGLEQSGTGVEIECLRDGANIEVSVRDNGVGLGDDFEISKSANLGLEIVKTLTENELNGELTFAKLQNGTEAKIRFAY